MSIESNSWKNNIKKLKEIDISLSDLGNFLKEDGENFLKVIGNTDLLLNKVNNEILKKNFINISLKYGPEFTQKLYKTYNNLKILEELGFLHNLDIFFIIKKGLKGTIGLNEILNKYKTEIIDFQISKGVIQNSHSLGAGNILGPKTNKQLQKTHSRFQVLLKKSDKYKNYMNYISKKFGIPTYIIIALVSKENPKWNPNRQGKGTAYGLGQATDENWKDYGKGLDRKNPRDQLIALARFITDIKNRKNCSFDEALGYYNTGLGIANISKKRLLRYYSGNPAIARKIPLHKNDITSEIYWKGAIALYTGKNFKQIKYKVK